MKKLIFLGIDNKKILSEIKKDRFKSYLILTNKELDNRLFTNKKIKIINLNIYKTYNRLIYEKKFYQFYKKLLINIDNLFTYKNNSLYEFLSKFFITTNFHSYVGLGELFSIIDILSKELDNNTTVLCYKKFYSLVLQIYKKKKINPNIIIDKKIKVDIFSNKIILSLFTFLRVSIVRLVLGKLSERRPFHHIVILSDISMKRKDINIVYDNLCKELSKEKIQYEILYFDHKNEFTKLGFFQLYYKIRHLNKRESYIGSYYSIYHIIKTLRYFFKNLFKYNSSKPYIKELVMTYKNINIQPYISNIFDLFFYSYSYIILDAILLTNSILDRNTNRKKIIGAYDDEPFILGFLFNRKEKHKVKIFTIQYELIYPGCAYNLYGNKNQDKEFVWGKYEKDVLINSYNYPKNKIIVSGFPRVSKISSNSNNNIKGISKNDKIICYASQGFENITKVVLDTAKDFEKEDKKIIFIIKPHPSENFSKIKNLIKEYKLSNIRFANENIYVLIKLCDIFISSFSTTILEAIIFEKPIIVINPYQQSLPLIYEMKKKSIVKEVKNSYELKSSIITTLKNRRHWKSSKYKYFIEVNKDTIKKIIETIK